MISVVTELHQALVDELISICGEQHVLASASDRTTYGSDETEDLHFMPAVVVKPQTADEISTVFKVANRERIPVTPRGAGTGLSGGALPVCGG
ncbi:MAG: FAD-binding oxidoreductase, partial [Bacteroidota bacterium]